MENEIDEIPEYHTPEYCEINGGHQWEQEWPNRYCRRCHIWEHDLEFPKKLKQTNIRLSAQALKHLEILRAQTGATKTALIEMALAKLAQEMGAKP